MCASVQRFWFSGISLKKEGGSTVHCLPDPDGCAVLFADVEPALRDRVMLEWLLPVIQGDEGAEPQRRLEALAAGLIVGLTGRDLVTYAMEGCP